VVAPIRLQLIVTLAVVVLEDTWKTSQHHLVSVRILSPLVRVALVEVREILPIAVPPVVVHLLMEPMLSQEVVEVQEVVEEVLALLEVVEPEVKGRQGAAAQELLVKEIMAVTPVILTKAAAEAVVQVELAAILMVHPEVEGAVGQPHQ